MKPPANKHTPTTRSGLVVLGGLGALVALVAPALGNPGAKEFQQQLSQTPNSWERRELVRGLDPADAASRDVLLTLLKVQGQAGLDWYIRDAVVDVLAGAYDAAVVEDLQKEAKKHPLVCEGVVMAFGRSGNKERIPWVIEQLNEHRVWRVQRAAAIALGNLPDKRCVEPLIAKWEKLCGADNKDPDKDFQVWIHILEALEKITREKNMPGPQDWRGWWTVVKDTWEVPTGDPAAEDEGSGEVVRTRVRGTNINTRVRGKGLPLLVLPDYGLEKDYLETYLRNLEDTNRILYMTLPGAADFVDPPLQNAPGLPMPWYPLERIVDAFEALHKELVEAGTIENEPFAILAHGMTCWVAMKYAEKYPGRVRKMILIAPFSGNKAWSDGRQRAERRGQETGDVEMEHHAQSQQYENGAPRYQAAAGEEQVALSRKDFTTCFADQGDLEIGRILGPMVEKQVGDNGRAQCHQAERPMGGVFIPDFSLFQTRKVPVQVLIMFGQHSVRTSIEDMNAIRAHYGSAVVKTFRQSSGMPFIEENEEFVDTVRRFMGTRRGRR